MKPALLLINTSLILATSTLIGCTTIGSGSGVLEKNYRHDAEAVNFSWDSMDDGQSGTISATLPDGEQYSGPFFQITSQTEIDAIDPLWTDWDYGWYSWDYWDAGPDIGFVTRYSGKVVANLQNGRGEHMRCRFHLAEPYNGMNGGGEGECQLPDKEHITAYFSAQ